MSNLTEVLAGIELVDRQVLDAEKEYAGAAGAGCLEDAGHKHVMFYIANAQGLIQLRQDSVFVADTIFYRGGTNTPAAAAPDARIAIELGGGRYLTHGAGPEPASLVASRNDRMYVDHNVFVPTGSDGAVNFGGSAYASYAQGNVADEVFVLPAELVLPRGGTVRVHRVPEPVAGAAFPWQFVLGGYVVRVR